MTSPLYAWAKRHGVSWQAVEELRAIFGTDKPQPDTATLGDSEAAVQSRVRLAAARMGYTMWRNNCGALLDTRGVPVRYGLANDTPALNRKLKSSDLIGWQSTLVTPGMVGTRVAVFASLEIKEAGWLFSGTERELGQERWLKMVAADGGIARFISDEGQIP